MRREDCIEEAEKIANVLHGGDLSGDRSLMGRARWNRAFHSAMEELVNGRPVVPAKFDYRNLFVQEVLR